MQPLKRGGGVGVGAEHAAEHLGVAQVTGDVDSRDGHEAKDTWILDVAGQEGGNLLAHRGCNAVGAMVVRRHG